jgi:serine/threonine-protein kinase
MSQPRADRDLLFGLLAFQNNFIDRDALLGAFAAWVADKSRPLDRFLLDRGALTASRHALLTGLVDEHLKLHGDDPRRSLAALSSIGSARRDLEAIPDDDLHASLAHVSVARRDGDDSYGTRYTAAGEPTSTGGRFRVLRFHAKGGLGQVSIALDQELDREIALKEIQDRYADHPESRARFRLEAEITGGLEHPGIIPVYALGADPAGRPFYAMRFIKGDNLHEALRRFHAADAPGRDSGERRIAFRKILSRFVDACNAVAYAHSRGILHRDLKPSNVMLGPYGETLVVDWGLAKLIDRPAEAEGDDRPLRPAAARETGETVAGSRVGTIGYMSPEQAEGRLNELGPATDVYSLGATLYHVLAGRPAFEGRDDAEVMARVSRGEFHPPRKANPKVPPALQAICLKAMARLPGDRYPTPRELAEDIEHWLADEPVTANPEWLPSRANRWLRRHPAVRAWILTGLVAEVALVLSWTLLLSVERTLQRIRPLQANPEYVYDAADSILRVFRSRISYYNDLAAQLIGAQAGAAAGALVGFMVGRRGARVRLLVWLGALLGLILGIVLGPRVLSAFLK